MQWNQVKSFKFEFFYDFVTKVKALVSDHPVKNVWSQNWSIEIRFSSHLCYIWKKNQCFQGLEYSINFDCKGVQRSVLNRLLKECSPFKFSKKLYFLELQLNLSFE